MCVNISSSFHAVWLYDLIVTSSFYTYRQGARDTLISEWTSHVLSRYHKSIYTSTYVQKHWEAMKNITAFYIVLRCFCDLSRSLSPPVHSCGFISMWSDNKKNLFFLYFHRTHKFIYTWKIIAFFFSATWTCVYADIYYVKASFIQHIDWKNVITKVTLSNGFLPRT